ncbi:CYFA0S09e00980g1_1 [Cyberlindnera fabianii]|uniref:CYFA0S09e00980g1_1 n=1 Tax=Cyberlindnera fabianii TaxID=36022 RepID=A0A061AXC2_CYBFA|nr:Protein CCC1 [Cyberlindnera fabianii]CDR42318.1 CYFA0S09e00980g1_1 [Cyberlindnera fabianii]
MSIIAIKQAVSALTGNKNDQAVLNPNNTTTYNTMGDEERLLSSDNVDSKSLSSSSSNAPGILGKIDPRVMSDIVIGLSDGLTVPFALTAGLSSLGDAKLVITGGFAELISGAISMGLGGYLAARSEADYYRSECSSEKQKFYSNVTEVNHQLEDILLDINPDFSDETIVSFIKDMKKNPSTMIDFVIRYGKGLEEPAENRELISAATIGSAYFFGGFIPLIPYFFVEHVDTGLIISIMVMALTLFVFGYFKAVISLGDQCSQMKKVSEAVQMVAVGGIAAGSAWFLVRMIG